MTEFKKLTPEELQAYKDRYVKAVTSTGREGIESFLAWLEGTDFYAAPASTKPAYHGCYEGGLLIHHLNVINIGVIKLNSFKKQLAIESITQDTINSYILAAACHDFCKVNTYKKAYLKSGEFKGEYKVEDTSGLNLGHGEKSVVMAIQSGLKLLPEELSSIRWHMGLWDAGAREDYPSGFAFKACHGTWLGRILSTSDYEAALLEKC